MKLNAILRPETLLLEVVKMDEIKSVPSIFIAVYKSISRETPKNKTVSVFGFFVVIVI